MILESQILINVSGRSRQHFEQLGYHIPCYIDKRGRSMIKKGTKILINIGDLPNGSGEKVTKICDDCGEHSPNQEYKSVLRSRENIDGKDRCLKCANKNNQRIKKANVVFENSLEYFASVNNKEHLILEFSNKNNKTPKEITYGTGDNYLWNCLVCNSEFEMSANNRTTKGVNCPYCAGVKVNHTNSLWTTNPEVASLLKNPQVGFQLTASSMKKEIFTCPDCKFEQSKTIGNVVYHGFPCVKCSDGISYPEKFILNVLDQLNIDFIKEKKFTWSKNKVYDFFIPSLNCIIEAHGGQHFEIRGFATAKGRSLRDEQENDFVKMNLAKNNLINHYVTLDCRESNLLYIKNSILNSELNKLLNFKNISWERCHEFSLNSLTKKASCLWENGLKSTEEIAKSLKISSSTVRSYLRKGTEIGWCDYDPCQSMENNFRNFAERNKKKIIQLSLDGEYIQTWDSMIEASTKLNIKKEGISAVCRGKGKTAGGFKWEYAN